MERTVRHIAAAIYIGSSALQMKIAESHKTGLKELDVLEYPLNLGQDTFSKGKISFENATKIGEALKGFFALIDDYQVKETCIVATIAFRDAVNKEYILDQILVKTGKVVHLLDDSEEKEIIYKEILKKLSGDKDFLTGRALMTYIGTGSLGVALYDRGSISATHNIRIGPLKLNEILEKIQGNDERSNIIVEEYLSTFTSILRDNLPEKWAEYFVASGHEMDLIAKLCRAEQKGELLIIQRDHFEKLYDYIKDKTDEQLAENYQIELNEANMLLPSMGIYKTLLEFTDAKIIIDPPVNLLDGLLNQMLFPEKAKAVDDDFANNTVIAAQVIGEKFKYDRSHALAVEKYALQIFDKSKAMHGLGPNERLLLQAAAILHDVGKYVNTKGHFLHSYYIIKNSDIVGLNDQETEMVGQIAMFHGKEVPHAWNESYSRLMPEQKAIVSKLVALLRIADALDRGHKQKFNTLDISLKKDKLNIVGSTYHDTHVEQWALKRKGLFFEEVYGVKAEFRNKRI